MTICEVCEFLFEQRIGILMKPLSIVSSKVLCLTLVLSLSQILSAASEKENKSSTVVAVVNDTDQVSWWQTGLRLAHGAILMGVAHESFRPCQASSYTRAAILATDFALYKAMSLITNQYYFEESPSFDDASLGRVFAGGALMMGLHMADSQYLLRELPLPTLLQWTTFCTPSKNFRAIKDLTTFPRNLLVNAALMMGVTSLVDYVQASSYQVAAVGAAVLGLTLKTLTSWLGPITSAGPMKNSCPRCH